MTKTQHFFYFFLFVCYRQQHTCTTFLAYKAIYVHIYMVSRAVQYCGALVGCPLPPGACLALPAACILPLLLLSAGEGNHICVCT